MKPVSEHYYEFGDFKLEVESLQLRHKNESAALPPKVAALLLLFLQRSNQIIKKEEIFSRIWNNASVEESSLIRAIYLLRKTLGEADSSEQFIETLPKIGYRFCAAVREVEMQPRGAELGLPISQTQSFDSVPFVRINPLSNAASFAVRGDNFGERRSGAFAAAVEISTDLHQESVRQNSAKKQPQFTVLKIFPLLFCGLTLALAWMLFSGGKTPSSIAVLPFAEIGADGTESAQGLGVSDTITSRLGNFKEIEVRPTAAVRRFAETATEPLEAGKQLRVETVLTGNIQRDNGIVRINAQLLRVADGANLWSATFDEPAANFFQLQDRLTDDLLVKLRLPVTAEKHERLSRRGTESLAAYNHYIKGRLFWNRRTPEWIQKAIAEFEAARAIDPNYAQAFVGIADSYALTSSGLPAPERMPRAKAAAERALGLDDQLAEAHASLGFIKYKFDSDWVGAETSLERAIELNPNYATAHQWLGELLAIVGRFDESVAAAETAEKLDPLSLPIKEDVGMAYYSARQFDRAEIKLSEVLAIDPRFVRARRKLALVYQVQEKFDQTVAERLAVLEINGKPANQIAALKQAHGETGWNGFWLKYDELYGAGEEDDFGKALIALRLGDKEKTFEWLEKSLATHGGAAVRIKTDPIFDCVRTDERFQALLRRANHN